MGLVRLVVFGFLALGIIYLSVSVYARSVARENLEDEWDEENPDSSDMAARSAYVEKGIIEYNKSFRPKLVGLVFVIPTVTIVVINYVINAN